MYVAARDAFHTYLRETGRATFPERSDPRTVGMSLFPDVDPGFSFCPGSRVFTIGSCFVRNIEEHLHGYEVPTLRFSAPKEEWPYRPNGLLNEFNPGTIAQRIQRAFLGEPAPEETIVPGTEGGFVDLLLPGTEPVSYERAFERRREVDAIYADLPDADVVIVTLGLIEAWIDNRSGTYLNRMPPTRMFAEHPDRYSLHIMDVSDAYPLLESAFRLLADSGKKVVMTVSPVPLSATFSGKDAVVANTFTKSVLRVCADRLSSYPGIDYFPSYEIVTSGGLANFFDDNRHVSDRTVGEIVTYMLSRYEAESEAPALAGQA